MSAFELDRMVLALVDEVRARTPTALLTNHGPLVLWALEHELAEVGRRFDPWGFACRNGAEKPDTRIFQALCDEAQAPAEAVFFIDDSDKHVQAAQALGMQAHHSTHATTLAQALHQL